MKLADLTTLQKRYLSRRVCWLCDMSLDRDYCEAIFEKCSPEVRAKRRDDCLAHYRPRAALKGGI